MLSLSLLRDDLSITVPDPDHSTEEDRFIAIGFSSHKQLLILACEPLRCTDSRISMTVTLCSGG
jgi:uncharacterized DUF497 family protein